MNNVVLIGRLTKDPELKYSQSGKAFSKFTVAVTREFNRDEADFINCVAWGKTAETIAEYLRKGKRIGLQGRLQTGSYQNNSGDKVYTVDLMIDKFEFVDNLRSDNQSYSNNNNDVVDDDDFPF